MAKKSVSPTLTTPIVLILIFAIIGIVLVGVYATSQKTNLTPQASNQLQDLNSSSEIGLTNNPDGTMGPPSHVGNFSNTLPTNMLGGLSFYVTDPPPPGRGKPSNAPTAPANPSQSLEPSQAEGGGRNNGPQNVSSLVITITKVEVHLAYLGSPGDTNAPSVSPNAGRKNIDHWETLNVAAGTKVDLVQIAQNGVPISLGLTNLAAGRYTEIRLYLSAGRATLSDGTTVNLTLLGRNNIVRVVRPFTITAGIATPLTIDFDAQRSVIKSGNDYILKPVVARIIGG